jgi:hypothetical protein
MNIGATTRRLLARHPWIWWALTLGLAVIVGLGVYGQLEAFERARSSWGETVTVAVADGDHGAGDALRSRSVAVPVAIAPPAALRERPPADATARQRIADGEILTAVDVTGGDGPAARADPGALVVPVDDPRAGTVSIGLAVQVVADGIVVADRGRIVDVADQTVFVAVPARLAPAVAAAAQADLVTLVYVP